MNENDNIVPCVSSSGVSFSDDTCLTKLPHLHVSEVCSSFHKMQALAIPASVDPESSQAAVD